MRPHTKIPKIRRLTVTIKLTVYIIIRLTPICQEKKHIMGLQEQMFDFVLKNHIENAIIQVRESAKSTRDRVVASRAKQPACRNKLEGRCVDYEHL